MVPTQNGDSGRLQFRARNLITKRRHLTRERDAAGTDATQVTPHKALHDTITVDGAPCPTRRWSASRATRPRRPRSSRSSAAAGPGPITDADMEKMPSVRIVIGMAGSGKTSLMQRINAYQHTKGEVLHIVNLDPAVGKLPYEANIDIQDTVNYRGRRWRKRRTTSGPTAGSRPPPTCSLRASIRWLVCARNVLRTSTTCSYQPQAVIEIFTWSASGAIVTESFASTFPTCVLFVVDTPRAQNPQAFMSNMLQAVSILYKTRLPGWLWCSPTRSTAAWHEQMLEWMDDFEKLHDGGGLGAQIVRLRPLPFVVVGAICFINLRRVGVSASGEGMEELFDAIGRCRKITRRVHSARSRATEGEAQGEDEKRRADALERMRRGTPKSGGERVVLDMERLKVNEAVLAADEPPAGSELD